MQKIKRRVLKLFLAIGYLLAYTFGWMIGHIAKLFCSDYRNVWLVCERGVDARDNGFVFYNYLVKEHPEVNSYYIIDKNSADYEKVSELGKTVQFKSLKHYMLLSVAKYNVSTHVMGFTPDMVIFVWLDKLHLIRGKKVFLQHGIIKDDMKFNHYPNISLDIFNTSAKPEYEYIKDTYGHPEGVVKMLGMCRYDNLHDLEDRQKNQILLMPTWRTDVILSCKSDVDFKKTHYYTAFQSLFQNQKLNELLEKNNLELVFYPHLEMQKFLHTFSSKFERIKIASFKDYDVQELLISSKLLITDYSSVFFDFAYMDKPEIFYQFDEGEYRKGHYQEGYFSYRRDGFGPVVVDEMELVDAIGFSIQQGFKVEEKYQAKIDAFFTLKDQNNCQRTFEAISSL